MKIGELQSAALPGTRGCRATIFCRQRLAVATEPLAFALCLQHSRICSPCGLCSLRARIDIKNAKVQKIDSFLRPPPPTPTPQKRQPAGSRRGCRLGLRRTARRWVLRSASSWHSPPRHRTPTSRWTPCSPPRLNRRPSSPGARALVPSATDTSRPRPAPMSTRTVHRSHKVGATTPTHPPRPTVPTLDVVAGDRQGEIQNPIHKQLRTSPPLPMPCPPSPCAENVGPNIHPAAVPTASRKHVCVGGRGGRVAP